MIQDQRILPHFHYSVQSFSDRVLRSMHRGYGREVVENALKKHTTLPGSAVTSLGADIIVGFPGETEEDFMETLRGIEEFRITKLHAFPFSAHLKGDTIPAFYFPDQIPLEIKKEREKRLIEVGDRVRNAFIDANRGRSRWRLSERRDYFCEIVVFPILANMFFLFPC